MIKFETQKETAQFNQPGKDGQLTKHSISFRKDPLTGRMSVLSEDLVRKAEMFFGSTDRPLIRQLSESSRIGCFFCPELVATMTPKYPKNFIPEGRLHLGRGILFPNLFPLAKIHAVITIPEDHYLELQEINSVRLPEIFGLSGQFFQRIQKIYPEIEFVSINANHMLPAGASLFHPHFQVFGSETSPGGIGFALDAAKTFMKRNRVNYWDELIRCESNSGSRWIGQLGPWIWITAFSPQGTNETWAVHQKTSNPFELQNDDYYALSAGIERVLNYFHTTGYSSFNFHLSGGLKSDHKHARCVARLITRQNLCPNYRTDDYYLQKFLGMELIVVTPENLAAALREKF